MGNEVDKKAIDDIKWLDNSYSGYVSFLDGAFNLWIGENNLSTRLKISIGMYLLANLHLPFTYFLNGIGKIKIR